jgi:soluble lytic murein transglycosylase-like protein
MQLMPATAQRLMPGSADLARVAKQLAEPHTNIAVGTRLLAELLKRHRRIDLALAAWNAGSGAVRRSGGQMPDNAETRAHVQQVLELYWALLQRRHSRGAVKMTLDKP